MEPVTTIIYQPVGYRGDRRKQKDRQGSGYHNEPVINDLTLAVFRLTFSWYDPSNIKTKYMLPSIIND